MKPIDLNMIQGRRRALKEERDHLQRAIEAIDAETKELDVAERVFARLALDDNQTVHVLQAEPLTVGSPEIGRPKLEVHSATASFAGAGSLSADLQVVRGPLQSEPNSPAGKPPKTPPMTEMIIEALEHASRLGAPGLKPAAVLSYIRGKWWPGAEIKNVGPIVWRMQQRGVLVRRDDGLYALSRPQSGAWCERPLGELAKEFGPELPTPARNGGSHPSKPSQGPTRKDGDA